jgi:hypothetical protein
VAAVIGVGEEGILLGVAQVRSAVPRDELDRYQGHPAAQVVHGHGVGEDDALVRHDVAESGAVLKPLLDAGRGEDALCELVAADPEVQLVACVLRRARDAEPAPAPRGLGVCGVYLAGRRRQVSGQSEGTVDDRQVV